MTTVANSRGECNASVGRRPPRCPKVQIEVGDWSPADRGQAVDWHECARRQTL